MPHCLPAAAAWPVSPAVECLVSRDIRCQLGSNWIRSIEWWAIHQSNQTVSIPHFLWGWRNLESCWRQRPLTSNHSIIGRGNWCRSGSSHLKQERSLEKQFTVHQNCRHARKLSFWGFQDAGQFPALGSHFLTHWLPVGCGMGSSNTWLDFDLVVNNCALVHWSGVVHSWCWFLKEPHGVEVYLSTKALHLKIKIMRWISASSETLQLKYFSPNQTINGLFFI